MDDQSGIATRLDLGFDLNSLMIFSAVCETLSMTVAAKQLSLTQSAVSHAIKQLETTLQVSLLDRTQRPMSLTTAGFWLAEASSRILIEARTIPHAMREMTDGQVLRLRLGIVHSLAVPFVPALIGGLKNSIRSVSFLSGAAFPLTNRFLANQLDLMITNDTVTTEENLVRHELLTEPYVIALPKDHRGRGRFGVVHHPPDSSCRNALPVAEAAGSSPSATWSLSKDLCDRQAR